MPEERKKNKASGDKGKKTGKKGSAPVWWSGAYSSYVVWNAYTLRTGYVDDMIQQIKDTTGDKLDKTGGCGNCIYRLTIRGHGHAGSVTVGYGKENKPRSIYSETVKMLEELKPYFCDEAEIVFWSCNTGEDEDFLQSVANATGATVSGLTVTTDVALFKQWNNYWVTKKPE
jgi:hypothetical protein